MAIFHRLDGGFIAVRRKIGKGYALVTCNENAYPATYSCYCGCMGRGSRFAGWNFQAVIEHAATCAPRAFRTLREASTWANDRRRN